MLEQLKRRASLAVPANADQLTAHPDAMGLPAEHIAHGRVVVHHKHSGHGHLRREPTSEAVTTPTRTSPASTSQPTV